MDTDQLIDHLYAYGIDQVEEKLKHEDCEEKGRHGGGTEEWYVVSVQRMLRCGMCGAGCYVISPRANVARRWRSVRITRLRIIHR